MFAEASTVVIGHSMYSVAPTGGQVECKCAEESDHFRTISALLSCSTFILSRAQHSFWSVWISHCPPTIIYSDSAKCVGPRKWNLPQGHAAHEFITSNGIKEIVQYNWYLQKTARNLEQYVRLQPDQEPHLARNLRIVDLADTMYLTEEGRAVVGRKGSGDVEVDKLVQICVCVCVCVCELD